MLVKICGITSMHDAEAAVEAGAGSLGFVFWPRSPRFIDPHEARAIVACLPAFVVPVGVFVNQPAAHVKGVAALVRLGAVQLHGDEDLLYASGMDCPVIKAVSLDRDDAGWMDSWPRRTTLLLDVYDPVKRGGTGRTIDWSAAAAIAARRRTLLAGGLTPENVADAVACVQPYGIDVSSGVERSPGVKDHGRVRALFEALGDSARRQTLRSSARIK